MKQPAANASNFCAWVIRLLCGTNRPAEFAELDGRQRIYFANHSSNLDFLAIWSCLPSHVRRMTRPVAALDYWQRGKVRPFLAARVFNALLIERRGEATPVHPVQRLIDAVNEGNSIIIFPEGTRNQSEEILPFKSGLYYLAKARPELDLVPIYLENLNRILPKGEVVPVPLLSYLRMGEPMRLREDENKEEFLDRARSQLRTLKESFRDE